MMIITCKLFDNKTVTQGLYVGQKIGYEVAREVLEVQADGDELMLIQAKMPGLPFRIGSHVQRWFGDDAKFIVGNW